MLAWIHSTASRTTMPSRTGTRYGTISPPAASPLKMLTSTWETSISGHLLWRVPLEGPADDLGQTSRRLLVLDRADRHALLRPPDDHVDAGQRGIRPRVVAARVGAPAL